MCLPQSYQVTELDATSSFDFLYESQYSENIGFRRLDLKKLLLP